jgi:hypothetical protein
LIFLVKQKREIPVRKKDPKISLFIFKIETDEIQAERIFINSSGRSSDFWIILLPAPSRNLLQWHKAAFIPSYSGGPVPDLHRVPSCALISAPERFVKHLKIAS